MMSRMVLAVLLVAAAASAQWTEPVPVPYESTWHNYDFVVGPGDTLWALWTSGRFGLDSAVAWASWSLGDSWSEPESTGESELSWTAAAACDGQGGVWFLWYNGMVPWDVSFSWGVMASVREAGDWRFLGQILASPGPKLQYASRLYPVSEPGGGLYVGINEHVHEGGGQYNSARLSRMQGDTLTWPMYVLKGDTAPNERSVDGPALVPRPDSGLWAVSTFWEPSFSMNIAVHAVWGDTATGLLDFPGRHVSAVGDSAGRLRVFYRDDEQKLWLATVNTDLSVEHGVIATGVSEASACVDCEGWLWCLMPGLHRSLVVRYNRGIGWSAPETVTDSAAASGRLVTDSQGRVYVFFQATGDRCWYSTYRTARPGVEEEAEGGRLKAESRMPTVTRAPELARVVGRVFDMTGREVTDRKQRLAPGVYFVRPAPGVERQASRVTKVVVTR
jgi:hypothetical protein